MTTLYLCKRKNPFNDTLGEGLAFQAKHHGFFRRNAADRALPYRLFAAPWTRPFQWPPRPRQWRNAESTVINV
jgi:hypothetical protein